MSRREASLAQARAAEVLRGLNIEAVDEIDIEAIAYHHGLRVCEGGLEGARGRLVSRDGRGIIRISADIGSSGQRRFVIAHELGHHLLHAARGKASVCLVNDFVRYEDREPETEANRFAAELLMPKQFFEPLCDVKRPSLKDVEKLSHLFDATLTAAAIRFVDLCPEACAVVWSEEGRVKWAARGNDFYGWIGRNRLLNSGSHAYDAFRGDPIPDTPQLVSASTWADRMRGDLYEDSRWFPRFKATLTLLWAPG
jgi:Zn-dependent peptidase ImmA (M78 family)